MDIVIDTSCLHVSQAGIPRYTRGLLRGLAEACPQESRIRTIEFGVANHDYRQPRRSLVTAIREGVWGPLIAAQDLEHMGAGLLHSPDLPIIRTQTPHVVTLHDFALFDTPHRYRPWQRWSGQRRMAMLNQYDRVICISEFTANEAMRRLRLPSSQIEVIPNGCDYADCSAPITTRPDSPIAHGDYFLFVGSLEPGKNLQLLVDTWALARQRRVELPPLIVVGARREGVDSEAPPPADWGYLGHVPDTELAYLYRHARALLFPSTYEGWGLPIVEAMALGCPVVASPLTAIPESAGDAALLVEQTPDAWLEAAKVLLQDRNREPLMARGRAHARKFTWKRLGEATWATYESVLFGDPCVAARPRHLSLAG